MEKFQKLWQDIKQKLKDRYNEETYLDLFAETNDVVKFEKEHIYVLVKNEWVQQRINQLYLHQINQDARRIYEDVIAFKFVTRKDIEENQSKTNGSIIKSVPGYANTSLNPNYTFDNFIVGKSNNYAFKVAMKVASQPGVVHNPLYIFGDVGLGKTHLMQAIGNFAIEGNLDKKILYAKANEFIEEYKYYLDNKNISSFTNKYRSVDMLLMDDIQMLQRATQSQSEFFKIFDRLKNENKQIVITCDRLPKDLKDIMDRLTSRFSEGLIIDINVPDMSHRIDILKHDIETQYDPSKYSEIPENCLEYIAEHFPTNIRDLKGALERAMTYCEINEVPHNLHYFKEALDLLVSSKKKTDALSENNYDKIQSIVASTYSITVDALIGTSRAYKNALPRHIAMYLIKTLYDVPYKKIGEIFSNRDHSTVLAACNKIEHDLKFDTMLNKAIENIIKKIKG